MTIEVFIHPGTSIDNKTGSWRLFLPKYLHCKCIGCGNCVVFCPEGCVSGGGKGEEATYIADLEFCKGCGICAEECPVDDIEMIREEE